MSKETIYLAGASGNVSSDDRWRWRDYCYEQLTESDFNVIHPHHYYTYEEDTNLSMRIIMDSYIKDKFKNVDIILVNLKDSNNSVGTGCEIGAAIALNKLIIGIKGDNCYPYIEDCCSYVCKDYEDAVDFIRRHF